MIRRRRRQPDEKRILVRAILRLPADLRDVFLLHRMARLSYEQIGEHLGMERDAVQARLAEALAWIVRATPSPEA